MESRIDFANSEEREVVRETWVSWPVCWSAVWVGTLTALALLVIFGLSGIALGAHVIGPDSRIVDWRKVAWGAAICSVLSAFFAFVIGGWVAGRIGGFRLSEPAMLHAAIAWLVSIPIIMAAGTAGGATYLGSWYGGFSNYNTTWSAAPNNNATITNTTQADLEAQRRIDEDARKATRNSALAAVTALLVSLIGSVIGGWMASGEPMTFNHHLRRTARSSVITDIPGNGTTASTLGRR